MRIGIVAEPPRIRSPFKISLKQASTLKERGHHVFFVTQERNLNYVASVFNEPLEGVEVIALPSVPAVSRIVDLLTRSYRTLEGGLIDIDITGITMKGPLACKKLLKASCEKLVVHSTLSSLSLLSIYAQSKIKKVLHLHDIPIHILIKIAKPNVRSCIVHAVKRFEEWTLKKADELVCTTVEAAESWHEIYGVNPVVLHPGCDPSPFLPFPKKDYVLSITSWEAERSPFFLLDLADNLRDADLRFVIAGRWLDTPLLEQFKTAIHERKLEDMIILYETISEKNLIELYQRARCIVYPAKAKLVMTSLEAAAQGTPILAPVKSGAWEIFEPDIHGFAVNKGDVHDYVENILKLKKNDLLRNMSYEIWKKSHEYSWNSHAAKLERMFIA